MNHQAAHNQSANITALRRGVQRYGFNGKEGDAEGMGGGGSTQDYGFRIYNSRLGKFLSIDPLFHDFPYYSPYHFAGNQPIVAIDLDGAEELIVITGVPGTINGIAFLRVSKSYYIDQMNQRKAQAISQLKTDYDARTYRAKRKDMKKIDEWYSQKVAEIETNFQKALDRVDREYSKVKEVPWNGRPLRSIEDFVAHIVLQGDLKEAMSPKEMEYFNGGGALIGKMGNSQQWDTFINTNLNGNPSDIGTQPYVSYWAKASFQHSTNFTSNSAELQPADMDYLNMVAEFMNAFGNTSITITGYTDQVGSPEANQNLSQARAESAMNYLIGQGIDPSRIKAEGKGETEAKQGDATPSEMANDRKITIKVE
jgi:RHS repeat-associated protein